jgi:benzoyl-CoA reductase/2-hydroxyglutaryl-CoA dehydratase subunit BcrC/BadD/HgdB
VRSTKIFSEDSDIHDLQAMMDSNDVDGVLTMMADICNTRAGDLEDPNLKKLWAENAEILNSAAGRLPIVHW